MPGRARSWAACPGGRVSRRCGRRCFCASAALPSWTARLTWSFQPPRLLRRPLPAQLPQVPRPLRRACHLRSPRPACSPCPPRLLPFVRPRFPLLRACAGRPLPWAASRGASRSGRGKSSKARPRRLRSRRQRGSQAGRSTRGRERGRVQPTWKAPGQVRSSRFLPPCATREAHRLRRSPTRWSLPRSRLLAGCGTPRRARRRG